jgi:hypothetical protein
MMNKFFLGSAPIQNENIIGKSSLKPVPTKRRALGDITNSVREEEPKDFLKKVPMQEEVAEEDDRVYMNRPCDDIDSRDNDNPLLVTDYVNDMYENFSQLEKEFCVNHKYMDQHDAINEKMRAILIDWLVSFYLQIYCEFPS